MRYFTFCICFAFYGIVYSANLPPGFAEVLVAEGLDPTAMALSPDGRLFITQKHGTVVIVENGQLLPDPFVVIEVDNYNERGLSGIAFHPDFAQNGYIYLYYTVPGANHNRVSRFTADGNYAEPGSETIILDIDPMNGAIHNAGAMVFGMDGKLYIAVGDGANGLAPQGLNSLLGKILRINDDGSIPEDNPFYNEAEGVYRAIYALGFRNPFSMAVQPGTGRIFACDVGAGAWEEVNDVLSGKNYGWALIEGPIGGQDPPKNYMNPFYAYNRAHGCAIVGAAFYNPATPMFPQQYAGKFFYADYCNGYIRYLNPEAQGSAWQPFATGINRPLNIVVADDGTMYYLARAGLGGGSEEDNTASDNGTLWRVFYTGSGAPFVSVQPQNILVSEGEDATFTVRAGGVEPITYRWQMDEVDIPGAMLDTYTINGTMLSDSGSVFRCIITNAQGMDTTRTAVLQVTSNRRPEPEMLLPEPGAMYRAGEMLLFEGLAIDPEDGELDATQLRWKIDFHHDTHTHPGLPPTSGISSGALFLPQTHETADNVWYRVYLTATDAAGMSKTIQRDVFPVKTQFHVTSVPEGLPVYIEASYLTTPVSVTSVVGIARWIEVYPSIVDGDSILLFTQWSDGVTTPARAFAAEEDTVTYVALYEKYALGTGTGVRGYYYDGVPDDATFYEPYKFTWIDSEIDFDWGGGSPAPGQLGDDYFLIRWEGFVEPLFTDTYAFHIIADDGIRLWIDSQLIIDAWIPQPPTEWTGYIDLQRGIQYPLTLEYFEFGGGAVCRFFWSSSKINKSIVPQLQLYPERSVGQYDPQVTRLLVYPNPANDMLYLSLDDEMYSTQAIEVYNTLGQMVYREVNPLQMAPMAIGIQDLHQGMYWVRCLLENGLIAVAPFVKY